MHRMCDRCSRNWKRTSLQEEGWMGGNLAMVWRSQPEVRLRNRAGAREWGARDSYSKLNGRPP